MRGFRDKKDFATCASIHTAWRTEVLEGLLGADLIGFHTHDYTQHFLHSVLRVLGHEHTTGKILLPNHLVKVDTFPMGVDQYQEIKRRIDELVGKINGKFGGVGWTPVLYQYRYLPFEPLVSLYASSHVALVTPLRDGMNLVAKEYLVSFTANIDVHVQQGSRIVEVRCGGIDKGTAALSFLPKDVSSFVLAIGDDWTDEDLFRVLPGSASSIRVGDQHSGAKFNLPSHEEVLDLLRELGARQPQACGL